MPTVTFNYTGADQSWSPPSDLSGGVIQIDAYGAEGGNASFGSTTPGKGGRCQSSPSVTPGEAALTVIVGQKGVTATQSLGGNAPASYGGGGAGGLGRSEFDTTFGGGGGGRTALRRGSTDIAVAGGGGGTGYATTNGGDAGGSVGADGAVAVSSNTTGGGGGTQTAGGAGGDGHVSGSTGISGTAGSAGTGGAGAPGPSSGSGAGGGGGGGYFGGGGGASSANASSSASGGGGGSGFGTTLTSGVRSGNGTMTITYAVVLSVTASGASTTNRAATHAAGLLKYSPTASGTSSTNRAATHAAGLLKYSATVSGATTSTGSATAKRILRATASGSSSSVGTVPDFLTAGTFYSPDGDQGAMRSLMKAGRTYVASAYIYVPAATGLTLPFYLGLRIAIFYVANGALTIVASSRPTTTNQFERLVTPAVTLPANTTQAWVRLYNGFTDGKIVGWDAWQIEENNVVTPYERVAKTQAVATVTASARGSSVSTGSSTGRLLFRATASGASVTNRSASHAAAEFVRRASASGSSTTVRAATHASGEFIRTASASGASTTNLSGSLAHAKRIPADGFFYSPNGDAGAMRSGMVAGQTYTVSAYIYVPTATGLSPTHAYGLKAVLYYVSGGTTFSVASPAATVTNQWQRLVVPATTLPANTTQAWVRLYNGFSNGEIVGWDAWQIENNSSASQFVTSPYPHAEAQLLYQATASGASTTIRAATHAAATIPTRKASASGARSSIGSASALRKITALASGYSYSGKIKSAAWPSTDILVSANHGFPLANVLVYPNFTLQDLAYARANLIRRISASGASLTNQAATHATANFIRSIAAHGTSLSVGSGAGRLLLRATTSGASLSVGSSAAKRTLQATSSGASTTLNGATHAAANRLLRITASGASNTRRHNLANNPGFEVPLTNDFSYGTTTRVNTWAAHGSWSIEITGTP